MSYRIPDRLAPRLQVGSAVIVPLSGYSRLGFVVELTEPEPERELQEIKQPASNLSLSSGLVELCRWISKNTALPLAVVLRNALPPGLKIDLYRITNPAPDWSWKRGARVERAALRRALGGDGLKRAEKDKRIILSPSPTRRKSVEIARPAGKEPDLSRAPRQRELFEEIAGRGECRVQSLFAETGARRQTLRQLAERGAIKIERRSGTSPVIAAGGSEWEPPADLMRDALQRGGAYLRRVPSLNQSQTVADIARAARERWEQTLVLAPEIRDVERLVSELARTLPSGVTVAPYHSSLGAERALVHDAARQGAVDVLVGTRAAALVPLSRPGAICVVDEPDPAHRADPGFEGVPLHVRELARQRGRLEEAAVFMLSPAPSLSAYASTGSRGPVRELPAPEPESWPVARVVDVRGSGATLSGELLSEIRATLDAGSGRAGVLVNRLGYAASVVCSHCGEIAKCSSCGLPLTLHGGSEALEGEMVCRHCAAREPARYSCSACGSSRMLPTGVAAERVRELLADALNTEIGLLTSESEKRSEARVVVGTAHALLKRHWEAVLVPDADSLLYAPGMLSAERAFRTLYSAAESAGNLLLAQTRDPHNETLTDALRGDYAAFAGRELARRRKAGYPPYRCLAALTLQGTRKEVRHAVESLLRPVKPRAEALEPMPLDGEQDAWRVVIRAHRRSQIAEVVSAAAEIPAASSGKPTGAARNSVLRIKIELDPEEV